jgi:hypothetical protein
LRRYEPPEPADTQGVLDALLYGLWNKLLNYPDFEPLPEILERKFGNRVKRLRRATLINDMVNDLTQDAGTEEVLQVGSSVIGWRSVTDAGKDHKRKELCARITCLRMAMERSKFCARKSVKKAFLVADGTFTSDDIKLLVRSGWDEIFYPDEMDELAAALV